MVFDSILRLCLVCGSYEPISKLSGNFGISISSPTIPFLVRTSFVIKGDHQVSSIYEIVENYAVQSVVTDNTTVSGSLKKMYVQVPHSPYFCL